MAGTLAAPRTAHPIERFARTQHRSLERWLAGHFGRQLSPDDLGDVIAETYRAALETEGTRAFAPDRMRAWAFQVARFRAIAVLRERHGRTPGTRRVPLPLSLEQDTEPDALATDSAYGEVAREVSAALREEEARRVAEAMRRLPADQRDALHLVHVDGLTTRAAAELLGTSKSTFNRLHQRALQRLHALCSTEQGGTCAHARALLRARTTPAPELLAWRDAHLEGCFACQVAAGRRVQLVLPALPVLSLPGALARLADRAVAVVTRSGLPPEAAAAGVTASAGVGSTLLGAKAAVCAVAAMTCAGAAVALPELAAESRPEPRERARAAAARTATPAPTAFSQRTPNATATATARTVSTPSATTRRASTAKQTTRRRAASASRRTPKSSPAAREFAPEAFSPTPAPPARPATTAAPATTPGPSRPRTASTFRGEFAP
jgi:RNA polymerase sigma factor (sigma-70 family)